MLTKKKSKIEVFTCKYCGRAEHSIRVVCALFDGGRVVFPHRSGRLRRFVDFSGSY